MKLENLKLENLKLEKKYKCHGGTLYYYSHQSDVTHSQMNFTLFLPVQAEVKAVPYLTFLSGLTCTAENFTTKGMAYRKASELGIAVLVPDTSPRGEGVPDHEAYYLGQGAGFYINATQAPWHKHFQMESYIIDELLPLIERNFPLLADQRMISGHSMGGHGALTLYLKYPDIFNSCSAFSPIVAPSQVQWGEAIFKTYLGDDKTQWLQHDATELVRHVNLKDKNRSILIDQGMSDDFVEEQLKPQLFRAACEEAGQALQLRCHDGYDHSYFFIQSFIEDHLEWHFSYIK